MSRKPLGREAFLIQCADDANDLEDLSRLIYIEPEYSFIIQTH